MTNIAPTYRLPDGTKVKVRILTDSVFNKRYGSGTHACWVLEQQTIYLRKSRHFDEQVEDLLHELDHAWVDARENLKEKLLEE